MTTGKNDEDLVNLTVKVPRVVKDMFEGIAATAVGPEGNIYGTEKQEKRTNLVVEMVEEKYVAYNGEAMLKNYYKSWNNPDYNSDEIEENEFMP